MEKKHPINDIMGITMEKVKEMVDVNTIVGDPIRTAEGVTIIPISKVSVGFASGGSDFASKHQTADKDNSFGGGAGGGISIDPVAFLVVKGEIVRMMPVAPLPGGPVERIIDLVPEVMDRVSSLVDKVKAEKSSKAEAEQAAADQMAAETAPAKSSEETAENK